MKMLSKNHGNINSINLADDIEFCFTLIFASNINFGRINTRLP